MLRTNPLIIKKRLVWSTTNEALLIDTWRSRLEDLRKARRNGHVYKEMSDELSEKCGIDFSPRDIQVKISNFTQRYRQEKKSIGSSDEVACTWPWYHQIDELLGEFPSQQIKEEPENESCCRNDTPINDTPVNDTPVSKEEIQDELIEDSSSSGAVLSSETAAVGKLPRPPRKRKKNFEEEILKEVRDIKIAAISESRKSERFFEKANQIEETTTAIIQKYLEKSIELQERIVRALEK